jgi:HPt (histidine-containing phosphotransfer) domain-containing protein
VEAFVAIEYAAVLMDCEMPQMDGFQATAELRRLERPGRRTPIVAITAHPVRHVRERCAAAGMDDCLTKPVEVEDLRRALAAVLPEQQPVVPPTSSTGDVDLTALTKLADLIGADALGALLETFWRETDKRLMRLREAVAAGDPREAGGIAHAIKGGASSMGAERVAKLSDELQHLADAGSLTDAAERTAVLEEAFARARAAGAAVLESILQQRNIAAKSQAAAPWIPHQPDEARSATGNLQPGGAGPAEY